MGCGRGREGECCQWMKGCHMLIACRANGDIDRGWIEMTTDSLNRATEDIGMDDVEAMPLEKAELPARFENFQPSRESSLDNEMMAEHGFPGSDAERFHRVGRIGGYMREFIAVGLPRQTDGADIMAATVAHLFDTPEAVHEWMHDVFREGLRDKCGG